MADSLNPNDRARKPAGFKIASYLNRSCHYNSIAWKTAQHFSYGARGFMRVPVSEANDLNFLLCRCDEAGDVSRLGNNEIELMKQIGLNNVTKNRTPKYPNLTNLIKQRTAADAGMVLGFIWIKEENSAIAGIQGEL